MMGSSPLSRGILPERRQVPGTRGIIPALAGNTGKVCGTESSPSDHPRSRGEYNAGPKFAKGPIGSSPLSRGIRVGPDPYRSRRRIIPALAGNTEFSGDDDHLQGDHPRSRGEYAEHPAGGDCGEGSSPLSRGIHVRYVAEVGGVRIIPALAGNTSNSPAATPAPSDHPRSRGEYLLPEPLFLAGEGSSPLSRGIRGLPGSAQPARGIIPALAGNTDW